MSDGGSADGPRVVASSSGWLSRPFTVGVNLAWSTSSTFARDFGGGALGVAARCDEVGAQLRDVKASGVGVVRWWMHPAFPDPGAVMVEGGVPVGFATAGTEVADIHAALGLADAAGVDVIPTLFSFDNFTKDAPLTFAPIVGDPDRRRALVQGIVAPIARAVAASPHAHRVVAWDIINEPEWAIDRSERAAVAPASHTARPRRDRAFTPSPKLAPVPLSIMRAFVAETLAVLRAESAAPVTVGQAAVKWAHAFVGLGLDYYDLHWYGWVDRAFPLAAATLRDAALDRPVVLGEFPLAGWTRGHRGRDLAAADIVALAAQSGFAGALAWSVSESNPAVSVWARDRLALRDVAATADGQRTRDA